MIADTLTRERELLGALSDALQRAELGKGTWEAVESARTALRRFYSKALG